MIMDMDIVALGLGPFDLAHEKPNMIAAPLRPDFLLVGIGLALRTASQGVEQTAKFGGMLRGTFVEDEA